MTQENDSRDVTLSRSAALSSDRSALSHAPDSHRRLCKLSTGRRVNTACALTPLEFASPKELETALLKSSIHISKLRPDLKLQSEWFALDAQTRHDLKSSGPFLTPGLFEAYETVRKDSHVLSVDTLILDLDSGNLSEVQLVERVGKHAGVAFETISSRENNRRWRVILMLNQSVTAAQYGDLFVQAGDLLFGQTLPDKQGARAAQPQNLPVFFDDYPPTMLRLHGRLLDVGQFDLDSDLVLATDHDDKTTADSSAEAASLDTWIEPPIPDLSIEQIKSWLHEIQWDDRDAWLKSGMALHHQFEGRPEGLELWDGFSRLSHKYREGEPEALWSSFDQQKSNPVTARTLKALAEKPQQELVDFDPLDPALSSPALSSPALPSLSPSANSDESPVNPADIRADYLRQIKWASEETEITERLLVKLTTDTRLDASERTRLIEACRQRVDEVTDLPMSRVVWNDLVRQRVLQARPRQLQEAKSRAEIRDCIARYTQHPDILPDWAETLVYVRNGDRFYDCETGESFTKDSLNAEFNRRFYSDGRLLSKASVFILDRVGIPVVRDVVYLPGKPALFFQTNVGEAGRGCLMVNLWRKSTVPQAVLPEVASRRERQAMAFFLRHIRTLLGPGFSARYVLAWLAWVVQNEGDHPNFALLLWGCPGTGKTALGRVLAGALGFANYKPVDQSAIESNYTDWAVGTVLNLVEEVRWKGKDKYRLLDKVKPLISNDEVTVSRKFRDTASHINTTAYFMTSNHADAVPVGGDRRYFVAHTHGLPSKIEINRLLEKQPDYFKRLHELAAVYGTAIRGYLLDLDISRICKAFNAKSEAYRTKDHEEMAAQSDPLRAEIRSVLSEISCGIDASDGVVSATALKAILDQELSYRVSGRKLALTLQSMGWKQWAGRKIQLHGQEIEDNRLFWNGLRHRVYVWPDLASPSATADELREILDQTADLEWD